MKRLAARVVCMFFMLPLPASAVETSILGTWRLQSFVREVIATGQRYNEFGEKPDGYISYLPEGRMHAILTIDDRMRLGAPLPTHEEKIKIGTTIGYAGTYTVAGDKITHRIEFSSNQSWTGTEQVRFYQLDGDTLTITTAVNKNPRDGQDARTVAVWKKVK
jgi:Lipocalin-like domain